MIPLPENTYPAFSSISMPEVMSEIAPDAPGLTFEQMQAAIDAGQIADAVELAGKVLNIQGIDPKRLITEMPGVQLIDSWPTDVDLSLEHDSENPRHAAVPSKSDQAAEAVLRVGRARISETDPSRITISGPDGFDYSFLVSQASDKDSEGAMPAFRDLLTNHGYRIESDESTAISPIEAAYTQLMRAESGSAPVVDGPEVESAPDRRFPGLFTGIIQKAFTPELPSVDVTIPGMRPAPEESTSLPVVSDVTIPGIRPASEATLKVRPVVEQTTFVKPVPEVAEGVGSPPSWLEQLNTVRRALRSTMDVLEKKHGFDREYLEALLLYADDTLFDRELEAPEDVYKSPIIFIDDYSTEVVRTALREQIDRAQRDPSGKMSEIFLAAVDTLNNFSLSE